MRLLHYMYLAPCSNFGRLHWKMIHKYTCIFYSRGRIATSLSVRVQIHCYSKIACFTAYLLHRGWVAQYIW